MKITVKSEDGHNIRLWFPTRILFSKTSFRIARKAIHQDCKDTHPETSQTCSRSETFVEHDETESTHIHNEIAAAKKKDFNVNQHGMNFLKNIPEEHVFEAIKALKNMKRTHPGVPLVEVESTNGDYVLIRL